MRALAAALLLLLVTGCGPSTEDVRADLLSGDESRQKRALEFARRMQRPDLAPDIVPLLASDNERNKKLAIRALDWLENPSVMEAIDAAAQADPDNARDILEIAYHLDDPDSLPMMRRFAEHEDEKVAERAQIYIIRTEEHLNRDVVFYSIGRPVRGRLAWLVYSQAMEARQGRALLAEGDDLP